MKAPPQQAKPQGAPLGTFDERGAWMPRAYRDWRWRAIDALVAVRVDQFGRRVAPREFALRLAQPANRTHGMFSDETLGQWVDLPDWEHWRFARARRSCEAVVKYAGIDLSQPFEWAGGLPRAAGEVIHDPVAGADFAQAMRWVMDHAMPPPAGAAAQAVLYRASGHPVLVEAAERLEAMGDPPAFPIVPSEDDLARVLVGGTDPRWWAARSGAMVVAP